MCLYICVCVWYLSYELKDEFPGGVSERHRGCEYEYAGVCVGVLYTHAYVCTYVCAVFSMSDRSSETWTPKTKNVHTPGDLLKNMGNTTISNGKVIDLRSQVRVCVCECVSIYIFKSVYNLLITIFTTPPHTLQLGIRKSDTILPSRNANNLILVKTPTVALLSQKTGRPQTPRDIATLRVKLGMHYIPHHDVHIYAYHTLTDTSHLSILHTIYYTHVILCTTPSTLYTTSPLFHHVHYTLHSL
jgi:hypothetical protein